MQVLQEHSPASMTFVPEGLKPESILLTMDPGMRPTWM